MEKDAAKRLERSLEINQPLQCAYLLKEELGELWQQDDGRKAWAFLREWSAKATASGIRQLQAMAKTLLRQAKGILSFYHTGLTSGKMEGINRKIRGLLASAFGFRDDDFLNCASTLFMKPSSPSSAKPVTFRMKRISTFRTTRLRGGSVVRQPDKTTMERAAKLSPEKQLLLEQRLTRGAQRQAEPLVIPKRPNLNTAPLSFAQRQMWVIDQMTPGNPAYNLPVGIRILGPLDAGALENSFNEIIRRHEALRTTFAVSDGEPLQVIHPELRITINITKLDHLPREEQENKLQALASEESVRSFDLTRPPLLRVALYVLGETDHVLIVNAHHIVVDGFSIGLMWDELNTLYRAFTGRGADTLSDLAVQYADFAVWQRQGVGRASYASQVEFWQKQLCGKLPVLELPCDKPRPAFQSFRGANVFFNIPNPLAEELASLGAREGCTFFMTILAAFRVLLQR